MEGFHSVKLSKKSNVNNNEVNSDSSKDKNKNKFRNKDENKNVGSFKLEIDAKLERDKRIYVDIN